MPRITTDGLVSEDTAATEAEIAQWAIATGSANVIEGAYPDPILELTDGLILGFRAAADNTTTTPTFAPDEMAHHTIVKNSGALAAGNIKVAGEYFVRYNATLQVWKLINPTG